MSTDSRVLSELRVVTALGRPGWRGGRRLLYLRRVAASVARACPGCGGYGAPDGCWWCGEPADEGVA